MSEPTTWEMWVKRDPDAPTELEPPRWLADYIERQRTEARRQAFDEAIAAVGAINMWAPLSGYTNPGVDDALLEAIAAITEARQR